MRAVGLERQRFHPPAEDLQLAAVEHAVVVGQDGRAQVVFQRLHVVVKAGKHHATARCDLELGQAVVLGVEVGRHAAFDLAVLPYAAAQRHACQVCDAAYQFGRNVGLAFQLVDDLLDFKSTSEAFGKPSGGADLQLGLATAPVLYAWQQFPDSALRELVPEGVEGAIVGSALYKGAFTLPEAFEVAGRP